MPTDDAVTTLLNECNTHSDAGMERLRWYALQWSEVMDAIGDPPPNLQVIECGTRYGGSALLWYRLGLERFGAHHTPFLWTVDPYGGKPYQHGNKKVSHNYKDTHYAKAKQLLATMHAHGHWRLRSLDFFAHVVGLPFWRDEQEHVIGRPAAIVFLDGDHDMATIRDEVAAARPLLHPAGRILIDNVESDGQTVPMLRELDGGVVFRPATGRSTNAMIRAA